MVAGCAISHFGRQVTTAVLESPRVLGSAGGEGGYRASSVVQTGRPGFTGIAILLVVLYHARFQESGEAMSG